MSQINRIKFFFKLEGGSWKVEGGRWKVEGGRWKLEAESWKLEGFWGRNMADFSLQPST
jgi:hypothetical protein